MSFLDEDAIDAACSLEDHQVLESNILASPGWMESDVAVRYQYNFGDKGPKLYGPDVATLGRDAFKPEIIFTGNSHCAQFGPVVSRLTAEYGVNLAFLCKDGSDSGAFFKPLNAWDRDRLNWMKKWNKNTRPRLIVWAERMSIHPTCDDNSSRFITGVDALIKLRHPNHHSV